MPESADLAHVWPLCECWGSAVFRVTKPAGILGAGGLVHFVLTLTWGLLASLN